MADVKVTIRNMTEEDIPEVLDIWNETGFQEGTQCLYTWLKVDNEGFKIAVTASGEVLGVCSAIIHHEDLAFVGLYVVKEKYRGTGIGLKVWNACQEHVGARNVGLNAVPGKQDLYQTRGGFPLLETRWTGIIYETHQAIQNLDILSGQVPDGVHIEHFQRDHLQTIFRYDLALMGYSRQMALELNFTEKDSMTFVAIKGRNCVGFGTIKKNCQNDGQVGPLYADDAKVAEALLKRLISALPEVAGLTLMTISSNVHANELIKKIGCPLFAECPRLYRKEKVEVNINKVFAHFDLNFSPY